MSLDETTSMMTLEPLSTSQRPGVIVVAVFALLSTLALVFIALRTIRLATVILLENGSSRTADILFFRSQLGYYAGCLILSNLLISLAGLIDFSWVARSGLSQGQVCSAQVVLTQIGIWATCWFSSALNVHTVIAFVFRIRPARWRNLVAIVVGWTIAFVAGLVPLQKSEVYGPVGPSCGITRSYAKDIFSLEALPIILAAFTSTALYSVRFIVSHGKTNLNGTQIARGPTDQRGEDKFEEHHGFISTISWTMFWFPFAFVLLLLPFCVTHILMFTGNSVPFASLVFADVCVYLLGFVNVCLLCNTLRVIKSMYRGPRSDETEKTFGNDASGESPIVQRSGFFSQSMSPPHENGLDSTQPQPSSNHSRGVSADSNTGLLDSEKTSYQSVRPEMVTVALSSPPHLSWQVGGTPSSTPWSTSGLESGSRISHVMGDTVLEPSTEDQRRSFQPATNNDAHTKGAREPRFRSKAPPSLDLSYLPNPWLSLEVTNKSSTLAARLGIPGSSVGTSSRTPVPLTIRKLDQEVADISVFRATPIPRIDVWTLEHADEPLSPTSAPLSDSDSDYSGEIMFIQRVRPLPEVPGPSEQGAGDLCVPSKHARSQRTTMTSVWSQETGYTFSQPSDVEGRGVHNQLVAHAGVGDQAGAIHRSIPSGPRPLPKSYRPKSSDERHSTVAFAPNDNTT